MAEKKEEEKVLNANTQTVKLNQGGILNKNKK